MVPDAAFAPLDWVTTELLPATYDEVWAAETALERDGVDAQYISIPDVDERSQPNQIDNRMFG